MKIDLVFVLIGSIQLLISLVVGILFVFAAYLLFKMFTLKIDDEKEIKNNNIALSIFMGATIFAVVWITKYSVEAGVSGIKLLMGDPSTATIKNYVIAILIMLGQITLSGVISFLSIWLAVMVFMLLTRKINEMEEVKKNNIAISILLGVIIIAISIFIEPAIRIIMNGLIPYPVIPIP